MSIFGTMRTGVSGMNAQANKLGTVGDNIANASTTGYKRASTSFSSLVLPSSSGSYASGGVQSTFATAFRSRATSPTPPRAPTSPFRATASSWFRMVRARPTSHEPVPS